MPPRRQLAPAEEKLNELLVLSAVDPLNLVGILTPEDRVPGLYRNRVLCRDGLPIAASEGGHTRRLAASELSEDQLRTLLARRSPRHPPRLHLRPTRKKGPVPFAAVTSYLQRKGS